ncbi:MAG: hypothetical protein E7583_05965 [Ruminococcaceae bacterium]|nr:hypothetical protein [Oscillospiraceae bacterium]
MKTSKNAGFGKKFAVSVLALSLLSQSLLGTFTAFADNYEPSDEELYAAGNTQKLAELKAIRERNSKTEHNLDDMSEILTSTTYADYRQKNIDEEYKKGTKTWTINAVDSYMEEESAKASIENYDDTKSAQENINAVREAAIKSGELAEYLKIPSVKPAGYVEGWDEPSLLTGDGGRAYWKFTVEETGLYTISAEYFPIVEDPDVDALTEGMAEDTRKTLREIGKKSSAERVLLIDGKVPFNEARYITFTRNWIDDFAPLNVDGTRTGFVQPERTWKIGADLESANNDKAVAFSGDDLKVVNSLKSEREPGRYFKYDVYYNEIRPQKKEAPKPMTLSFKDANEFYEEPFEFYLEAGEHVIALDASREPLLIKSFTFAPAKEVVSYKEYTAAHKDAKAADTKDIVKIDAEFMMATSEQVIYPLNDRTSPITDPQHSSEIKLNTIGGEKWQLAGQWVDWEFEVPADGLYYIVPRYMQNVNAGLFSSRKIYIKEGDGEYVEPFTEARNIRFEYSDEWTTKPLGGDVVVGKAEDGSDKTEYQDFKFYFKKGTRYTLRMEVVLGDMGDVILEINESLQRMNEYYRKILMITGTQPDSYLDYNFDDLIPDVLSGMRSEQRILENASARLEELVGEKGDQSVTLDKIAYLLDIMGHDQDKVAQNLSNFKSYIGTLGTWLLTARNQPLTLDYILMVPATEDYYCPKANAGFFKNVGHEFSAFWNSFFTNYNSVGATVNLENDDDCLEVWITTGRDQAQIVRQMLPTFSSMATKYNDPDGYPAVNLKLIAAGTLLPATLAGIGPDLSMDGDPVSFGVRNAVLNLNDRSIHEAYVTDEKGNYVLDENGKRINKYFSKEDLDIVRGDFADAAFIPLEVYNPDYIPVEYGVAEKWDEKTKSYVKLTNEETDLYNQQYSKALYGLPETQSFPMMFYRKDIFAELQNELGDKDVKVPETWDDLYNLIRVFSDKNMEIGLNTGLMQYIMYQNDVPWYKGDDVASAGMATNLDSDEALDAFKTMCDFFTQYQQPYTYDFANRFRTGEMPLGIADYSLYNQLTVFAPEIKGLWEFVQLPGSLRKGIDENGETYSYIDHTAPAGVGSVLILKQKEEKNEKYKACWNYIKWWTSTEIQGMFGNEQVAIIGTAAKYNTANKNAMLSQSWSADERRAIEQQFESLEGTPMTPGNYIVARNQQFAFLAVYNDGATPADAMQRYISDINKELSRKRDEYDFRVQEQSLRDYQMEQEERLTNDSNLNPNGTPVKLDYLGSLADQEEARNAAK